MSRLFAVCTAESALLLACCWDEVRHVCCIHDNLAANPTVTETLSGIQTAKTSTCSAT